VGLVGGVWKAPSDTGTTQEDAGLHSRFFMALFDLELIYQKIRFILENETGYGIEVVI